MQQRQHVRERVGLFLLTPDETSSLIFHRRASTYCRTTGASETSPCVASPCSTHAHTCPTCALNTRCVFCSQIARQQQQLLQQQHKINLLQQQIQVRPARVSARAHVCAIARFVVHLCGPQRQFCDCDGCRSLGRQRLRPESVSDRSSSSNTRAQSVRSP